MSANVAVIGAGVVGSAVAAELSRRGASVTIFEAGRAGRGTSGATFAWVNSNENDPPHYHNFRIEAMALHERYVARSRVKDWYHTGGNVEWRLTDEDRARLDQKVDRRLELGYDVRWLNKAQLLELEPDLNAALLPDDGIAFYPTETWVDTPVLVSLLLQEARELGARVVENTKVTGFVFGGDRVTEIVANGEHFGVDAVVNCAGAEADEIAGLAGIDLPLNKVPGLVLTTEPICVSIGRIVHAPGVALRPDGGGRLMIAGGRVDAALDDNSWAIRRQLLEPVISEVEQWFPTLQGVTKLEHMAVAVRPIPRDRLPVLGPADEVENFHFAVSHSGVTLCHRMGEVLADQVLNNSQPEGFDLYRIDSPERSGDWSAPKPPYTPLVPAT